MTEKASFFRVLEMMTVAERASVLLQLRISSSDKVLEGKGGDPSSLYEMQRWKGPISSMAALAAVLFHSRHVTFSMEIQLLHI